MTPDDQKNYWQETTPPAPEVPNSVGSELPMTEPGVYAESTAQEAPVAEEAAPALPGGEPITWSAQEYVHADKGPLWFIVFIVVVLALIAIDIFLLKSWTFSALVVVMAITLLIYIRRPARTLTYGLSPQQGLYVGEKLYTFDEFKSFGVIQDAGEYSIMLIPRKRFAPGVSVFFPQEAGERIVDILGQRLPMEELKLDIIDVVVRKLRL